MLTEQHRSCRPPVGGNRTTLNDVAGLRASPDAVHGALGID